MTKYAINYVFSAKSHILYNNNLSFVCILLFNSLCRNEIVSWTHGRVLYENEFRFVHNAKD